MKKIVYLVPICLATLSMSMSARADGLNLAPYLGTSGITMTVEPYASGETNGSYYVGLTQVNIALNGTPLGSVESFCDDFTHEINVPATYSATIQAVAGNTTLEQEAYYGMMFGTTPSGNAAMDSDIQELIWNFTAPANQQYAMNSELNTLQQQMLSNYQTANYSDSFYLNAGNNGQSFMVTGALPTDPSPVPEPSTLAMFGTGLFAVAGFARRRFIRN
jgi:hypothetical protein